jgi:hypothetical protein
MRRARAARRLAVAALIVAASGVATRTGAGLTGSAAAVQAGLTAVSCATVFEGPELGDIGSAYIAGFSNASKLGESALIGPGPGGDPKGVLLDINDTTDEVVNCTDPSEPNYDELWLYDYNDGSLVYDGKSEFPPARDTFLTYGFMPTTATLNITQDPLKCVDYQGVLLATSDNCLTTAALNSGTDDNGNPIPTYYTETVASAITIRLSDVKVDGVPLNVGPDCHTATPATATLTASSVTSTYSLATGGPLTGTYTVPSFTGCGVGENLDPLFDAAISGPGNYLKLIQGPSCLAGYGTTGSSDPNCAVQVGTDGYTYGLPNTYPVPER